MRNTHGPYVRAVQCTLCMAYGMETIKTIVLRLCGAYFARISSSGFIVLDIKHFLMHLFGMPFSFLYQFVDFTYHITVMHCLYLLYTMCKVQFYCVTIVFAICASF